MADRKFKALLVPPRRPPPPLPPAPPPPGRGRVTRRAAPTSAACSPAARGGTRAGQAPLLGGHISKGILHAFQRGFLHAQRDERHLRCAHVANEPMHDGVGLGNPIERGLASTGRG